MVAFPFAENGCWRLVHASNHPIDPSEADHSRVNIDFEDLLHKYGQTKAEVSDPAWTSAFKIHRRVADRFREGRGFIAGDAAQIHGPAGGRG